MPISQCLQQRATLLMESPALSTNFTPHIVDDPVRVRSRRTAQVQAARFTCGPPGKRRSKLQFQRKLNLPRPVDLDEAVPIQSSISSKHARKVDGVCGCGW